MSFPIADPQFWLVTAIVVGAAFYLLRPFIPARFGGKRGGPGPGTRATLTVGGKAVERGSGPARGPVSDSAPGGDRA